MPPPMIATRLSAAIPAPLSPSRRSCVRHQRLNTLWARWWLMVTLFATLLALLCTPALAQTAPTAEEIRIYAGLHEAAAKGDVAELERLVKEGERINIQDSRSRTPLHVAVYLKRHQAARLLLMLGANPNALEIDRYDIVTIAAVANDLEMLKIALDGGA